MDPKWETPALKTSNTIDEISDVAERMSQITGMLESVMTHLLSEGVDVKVIDSLRGTFASLHEDERGSARDEEPYSVEVIRTVHVAAIAFREMGRFFELASQAFIVDHEVQYGGES